MILKKTVLPLLIIVFLSFSCESLKSKNNIDPNNARLKIIIDALEDIQKETKNGNTQNIVDKYVHGQMEWLFEACDDTMENEFLDRNSQALLEKLGDIFSSTRFSGIVINSNDTIILRFTGGPKELFPQQKISILKDISNANLYHSVFKPASSNDIYSTEGSYSISIKIINNQIDIYCIALYASC